MKKEEAWKQLLDGHPIRHSTFISDRHIYVDGLFIYEYRDGKRDKTGYNYFHESDGWELHPVWTQEEIDRAKKNGKELHDRLT